jgi:SpoIID/LytB domain protein
MTRIDATYHRPVALPDGARGPRRSRTSHALALLVVILLTAAPATASALASPARTLLIEGTGDGHGVGMSQDGALGYARHGYTYQQILAHYYTGTAIGQAPPKTIVKVLVGSKVKRVPLERYVRGVIGAEMSPSWPAAALEAQAVASRTYALTDHAGGSRFDVYSDTRSQVYRGAAAETASTNAAVAATAGQLLTYAGKPVITYFFASSGGMTENIENAWPGSEPEPWLKAVSDPYDAGSAYEWKIEESFASAAKELRGLYKGAFVGIEVLKRGVSPRIVSARILGSTGASVVSGPELAGRLGLGSTWEYFSVKSGSTVKAEPDHSGQKRSGANVPAPAAPAPPPTTGQGGVAAAAQGSSSQAGGTVAGP